MEQLVYQENDSENEEDNGPEAKRTRPQQTRQYVPEEEICSITMGEWREFVEILKYENVKNLLP